MLFPTVLFITKTLANRRCKERESYDFDCFSESESCSSGMVCHPKIPICHIEKPNNESKKCLLIFQQIEFFISGNRNIGNRVIKDNYSEMSRAIMEILHKSNEQMNKNFLEIKTGFTRFIKENFKTLANEANSDIEKYIAKEIQLFNEDSVKAAAVGHSAHSVAISSLSALEPEKVAKELSDPNSSYNKTVASIIYGVALANNNTFNLIAKDARREIDKVVPMFKNEFIELLTTETESISNILLTLVKSNTNDNMKETEIVANKYRDLILSSMETAGLKLFEIIKFLLNACREKLTGEKVTNSNSFQNPMLFPGWNADQLNN